jgi:hypothetical protein
MGMDERRENTGMVIGWDDMDWILLVQDRDQWQVFQDTVMIFLLSYNTSNI